MVQDTTAEYFVYDGANVLDSYTSGGNLNARYLTRVSVIATEAPNENQRTKLSGWIARGSDISQALSCV
jgi:hypothetical protein